MYKGLQCLVTFILVENVSYSTKNSWRETVYNTSHEYSSLVLFEYNQGRRLEYRREQLGKKV